MFIKVPPTPFIRRRKRVRFGPQPTPPATLNLVAAEYNHDVDRIVVLTFDRAIDIAGLDGNQIVVDDGADLGLKFKGTGGATLDNPTTLRILLDEDGDATGVETTLTASAGNGIVAADDGGTWAGVTELGLPFGE